MVVRTAPTIAFLHVSAYNGHTTRSAAVGGIEHATVSLAEAFVRAGYRATVYNQTPNEVEVNGVRWTRLRRDGRVDADVVIVNNDVRLLEQALGGKKVVWFHNPLKIHRLFKRGNLFPVYTHRPHAVFLGRYHQRTANRVLPFASRRIIEYAHSPEFVRQQAASVGPAQRAVFTSQPYRGLKWVLDVWSRLIRPAVPAAELHVFAADRPDVCRVEDYKQFGVVKRGRLPRSEVARELMAARLLLCPGHPHETYCFAAAEATTAGLPIVSRGIGSLAERVQHGSNGYIAHDADAFARHAIALLADDGVWLKMHATTMACRDLATWDQRVAQWADAFLK